MPFFVVTAPASEPVTLAEAKSHLRLEIGDDDADVNRLIAAARLWAEEYCWRGFVTQVWELVDEQFPNDSCLPVAREGFKLPRGNLVSVASVKYIDVNGVEQTLAGSEYTVDTVSEPGRVRRAYGKSWPSYRSQWDAVRIRYTVGWSGANVPAPIKQALLLLIAQMYENRVPEVTGTIISKVGFAVEALLQPYRLLEFV